MRNSRFNLSLIAVLLLAGASTALTQQPPAPAAQSPRPPRAPRLAKPFQLLALTPELWKLFDHDVKLETMGTGFGFTEGPVWDPTGYLWVSDETKNEIVKLYPDGHSEEMVSLADPDGSTYDKQGRLLSTASGLRAIIRLSADGKDFSTVVDRYQGKRLNTPNDIVIGPDGAIYFTDPIIDMTHDQQQELPQSVYRLGNDNSLTLLTTELTAPNGLAFSPDGKYLFIDDDDTKEIHRYKFNKDGTISDRIVFGDMKDPNNRGVPDGMKVDRKGNLFVSGPNGIWVWNSKGVHIGTVQMPQGMANLTWGGPGYSKLYITAGSTVFVLQTRTHGILGYLKK